MRVESATVSNFRCVIDSGRFQVEPDKTILVGINEAGKTALLKALQHASPTDDTAAIDWLFDAPASMVDDIRRKNLDPAALAVARVVMRPEEKDLAGLSLPDGSDDIRFVMTVWMSNKQTDLHGDWAPGRADHWRVREDDSPAHQRDGQAI
ncbi:hypothetical protein [Gordonia sputi]